jgi:tetratricopeptide (TPR) repeat protein
LGLIYSTAGYPFTLSSQGKLHEAWEYVQHQIELLPHPMTWVSASIVCYHLASKANGEERRAWTEMQIKYHEQAWSEYQQLPAKDRDDPLMHDSIAFSLETYALGMLRLGDRAKAKEAADAAIRFGPQTSGPWTVRGIVTYPSEQAIADFRKASGMQDANDIPHYYLALHSLRSNDPAAALGWCEKALAQNPDRSTEAQLYGWIAICRDCLGAPRKEIDTLFRKALEIDPDNPEVLKSYRHFQDSPELHSERSRLRPEDFADRTIGMSVEQHVSGREARFRETSAPRELFMKELVSV